MLRRWWLPITVFAALLLQGAWLGLSDDEAYYWVLAQRPALGYAFHPPGVGLAVALSQTLFGWLLGTHSVVMVRLPAALIGGLLVALGMRWIESTGGRDRVRGGVTIALFAGIYALAWMIVPDIPMFLGWTLAFVATWEVCFGRRRGWAELAMAAGVTIAILSKFSAVLAGLSALISVWIWAPRERRVRATGALVLGGLAAAVPIIVWNIQHEWASILYQIKDRHGGAEISWVRYGRFWAVELLLMGPGVVAYAVWLMRGAGGARKLAKRQPGAAGEATSAYVAVWALPGALIFCTQPLWSDFKPHWALVVWWPLALGLAAARARGELVRTTRAHWIYGAVLISVVWMACHVPVMGWVVRGRDPRLDVTNDLYGWSELRERLRESMGEEALRLPVLGSRYQTAAQASFVMGAGARATMLPRDLKAMDEWPALGISDSEGPGWPRLTTTALFVGDSRYDSGPDYVDTACARVHAFESRRFGLPAKTIYVWRCEPRSARP